MRKRDRAPGTVFAEKFYMYCNLFWLALFWIYVTDFGLRPSCNLIMLRVTMPCQRCLPVEWTALSRSFLRAFFALCLVLCCVVKWYGLCIELNVCLHLGRFIVRDAYSKPLPFFFLNDEEKRNHSLLKVNSVPNVFTNFVWMLFLMGLFPNVEK